jgi:hypothetical protein
MLPGRVEVGSDRPRFGVETPVGTADLSMITSYLAIDPASHTLYITQPMSSVESRLFSIDDQTGAVVPGPPLGGWVSLLVFQP